MVPGKACTLGFAAGKCRACGTRFWNMLQLNLLRKCDDRCDRSSRSSAWSRGKRRQQFQAIGRSRGGLTTKIHAIVDTLGNPLRFELTGGKSHDCVTGYEMLKSMELTGTNVLTDRAYGTNAILNLLEDQHAKPVIPSKNLAVFRVIVMVAL